MIVLYDACVLYPAPLRDLLMYLALADLYQAKWTNEIHDEWIRNVLIDRPDLTRQQLERTRSLMNSHVHDCLVDNYQNLIPKLKLPDQDDRHILAAAIHSQSSVIITYNLKDFPEKILLEYGIIAQHPDHFLVYLIDHHADIVFSTIRKLRSNLKNPTVSTTKYLSVLEKQSLPKTVKKLKEYRNFL